MLLGILPFALFAYFSIGQDAPEEQQTPDVIDEEALNATSVQLAFPFAGPPPAPLAPIAPIDNVPLEIPETEVPASAKQCSNGKDDDRDGKRDYPGDPGCSSRTDSSESPNPAPKPTPVKALVAPAPAVVAPAPAPKPAPAPAPPAGKTACTDRVDNDKDGKVDGEDPGCSGSLDLNEADPPPPRSPRPPSPTPSVAPSSPPPSPEPSTGTGDPNNQTQ